MFLPLKDENPTTRFPVVTVALLVANGLAFAWMLGASGPHPDLARELGFVPAAFGHGQPAPWGTLVTAMFLHGGFVHVAGNLLFLWIFGNNVEDELGPVRFAVFYLVAGLGAHAAHWFADPTSTIPTVGASGAIAGVLAAYVLRWPDARVLTLLFLVFFVRVVRVPAVVLIGLWIALQIWNGAGSFGQASLGGGVAWFEHLGGFATGLVLYPALGGRLGRWASRRRGVRR